MPGKSDAYETAEKLAKKIKSLEANCEQVLLAGLPYVLRLDGNSFKNYTAGLVKPFDGRLTLAFVRTMNDLIRHSNAVTGFTQSDEITLVFHAEPLQANMSFAGRVSKIVSVYSSMAAARFNYYMGSFDWRDRPGEVQDRMRGGHAFFDGRVFSVPDDLTAMQALYWRHKMDCRRNAIHSIGIHAFDHKVLHGLSLRETSELLKRERSIDIAVDIPKVFLYGVFAKRSLTCGQGKNPLTGEVTAVMRSKVDNRIFDWSHGGTQDKIDLAIAKFWSEGDPSSVESLGRYLPVSELPPENA